MAALGPLALLIMCTVTPNIGEPNSLLLSGFRWIARLAVFSLFWRLPGGTALRLPTGEIVGTA